MSSVFWHLVVLVTLGVVLSYGCSILIDESLKTGEELPTSFIVTDRIDHDVHHLSGRMIIPSLCHSLAVSVTQEAPHHIHIGFTTSPEPYRDCEQKPVWKRFHTVAFAPAVGTTFTASLDSKPITLNIIRMYAE